jgi:hypothetical protein
VVYLGSVPVSSMRSVIFCSGVRVRGSPHSVGAVFVHNVLEALGFLEYVRVSDCGCIDQGACKELYVGFNNPHRKGGIGRRWTTLFSSHTHRVSLLGSREGGSACAKWSSSTFRATLNRSHYGLSADIP